MTIGKFLERALDNGEMNDTDLVEIRNRNNNIVWRGKAGYYPIYADHMEMRGSVVDRETTVFFEN